ncbi:MAG: transglutaminase domain-containing protein [Chloroflexi bacterium]|nr:transglutaminase domain-containing protein [Chloroflexota bacterium]
MNKKVYLSAAVLWVLVVLYPNPAMFFATLWRTVSLPIDANAARSLASTLPDDPNLLRDLVLTELVPYEINWNVYDVPWYFPSTAEVIRDGRGDCEGQAVLLASILQAKGIPYQLKMSFDHMWIDFQSKNASGMMEQDEMAFAENEDGALKLKVPKHFDLKNYIDVQLDGRWHPMPDYRKVLLFVGLLLILGGPRLARLGQWLKGRKFSLQTE